MLPTTREVNKCECFSKTKLKLIIILKCIQFVLENLSSAFFTDQGFCKNCVKFKSFQIDRHNCSGLAGRKVHASLKAGFRHQSKYIKMKPETCARACAWGELSGKRVDDLKNRISFLRGDKSLKFSIIERQITRVIQN